MTAAEVGLERPHFFLPAADPATAGPPLLLLHGTGGNEYDLLPLRERLSPGAAVLAVRGTVLENGMPRFFRRLREGVFDEDDLARRADDLAGFIATASAAYGIADRALVAVGFSNGANIASAVVLRQPGVLAAAVLLSAMIPFATPPEVELAGTRVVISNGARDPMIPASMTAELVAQLRDRGADVLEVHHGGGHQIDPAALDQIRPLIARPERLPDVRDNPAESRYEIYAGDELAGFCVYTLSPGVIAFTHTEVFPQFGGQGLAKRLVTSALDDSRRRGLGVLPFCPYVRRVIAQNKAAYLDLVPVAERGRFGLPEKIEES